MDNGPLDINTVEDFIHTNTSSNIFTVSWGRLSNTLSNLYGMTGDFRTQIRQLASRQPRLKPKHCLALSLSIPIKIRCTGQRLKKYKNHRDKRWACQSAKRTLNLQINIIYIVNSKRLNNNTN